MPNECRGQNALLTNIDRYAGGKNRSSAFHKTIFIFRCLVLEENRFTFPSTYLAHYFVCDRISVNNSVRRPNKVMELLGQCFCS